jgi:hypothetical protein
VQESFSDESEDADDTQEEEVMFGGDTGDDKRTTQSDTSTTDSDSEMEDTADRSEEDSEETFLMKDGEVVG